MSLAWALKTLVGDPFRAWNAYQVDSGKTDSLPVSIPQILGFCLVLVMVFSVFEMPLSDSIRIKSGFLFQVKRLFLEWMQSWRKLEGEFGLPSMRQKAHSRWTPGDWMLWLLLESNGPSPEVRAAWGWDPSSSLGVTILEGAFSWDQSRVTLFACQVCCWYFKVLELYRSKFLWDRILLRWGELAASG